MGVKLAGRNGRPRGIFGKMELCSWIELLDQRNREKQRMVEMLEKENTKMEK